MKNSHIKTAVAALAAAFMLAGAADVAAQKPKKRWGRIRVAQPAEPAAQPDEDRVVRTELPAEPIRETEPSRPQLQPVEVGYTTPGLAPGGYDSLLSQWYENNVIGQYEEYFRTFVDLDSAVMTTADTPDSVFMARLKMIVSPISLSFNEVVRNRIVAYTRGGYTVSRILGLSQVYFPMIEETLCRYGLPLELRMLPVVESALNPTAISRAGAAGLWQFMYGTGKYFGLEVTSLVDERFDPVAATDAACRYLRDLYAMYGDWTLALAAYNCGPGNVNKAIKRAGDKAGDFWSLYPYLPRETRGYVPTFIAATYAYAFHRQHDITPTPPPLPVARDTVQISRLMHLGQVASTLDMPLKLLKELNPQYKLEVIPAVDGRTYPLTLPVTDIARYIENEEAIQAKDSLYLADYLKRGEKALISELAVPSSSAVHVVKSGDTLGAIARKYGVKVAQLMDWNNIRNAHTLRIGQRIQIYK